MLRVSSDISIEDYKLQGITSCEITSSWETITDVCTLTFPRNTTWKGKPIAFGDDKILKKGDFVDVQLGYDDNNVSVFSGYITTVKADIPTVIHCEDDAWLYKKDNITKSYKTVNLATLLDDLGFVKVQALDIELGALRITNSSPIQVLDQLWKKFFIRSWFRDGVLYSGLSIVPELQKTVKINFDVIPEHNLEFRNEDEIEIGLKVINVLQDDSRKEYFFGSTTGEQRTHYLYNQPDSMINQLGEEQLQRLRYTGFYGDFTTFGQPTIKHGDVVELIDEIYTERNGSYFVKQVKTMSGVDGFRQNITLDSKVNNG